MTTKELIREKIDAFYAEYKAKFHQNGDSYHLGIIDGLDIAERILDTLEEPVSEDLEEAAEKYARLDNEGVWKDGGKYKGFIAEAEWMAKQGVSYQATISADKTIPVLPMKDVSDMGLDYGDRVRIIIVKEK